MPLYLTRPACDECGRAARCERVTPPAAKAERWLCQPCADAFYLRRLVVNVTKLAIWLSPRHE